jgi:hypothetical protein
VAAPPIRISLLVLYFFAFFHKLNTDWFDPQVSCGTFLYAALRDRIPTLPGTLAWQYFVIYSSLAIEAVIPLFLFFARTRNAALLLGVVFHWILALHPYHGFYNFSSMLFALFALFIAPPALERAARRIGEERLRAVAWFIAVGFVWCYVISVFQANREAGPDPFVWLFTIYGAAVTAAFVILLRAERPANEGPRFFALRRPVLVALPLVVFLNGLTPYFGLKTEVAWAMFSNLRTEGGVSNHLVMPVSLQVFDYGRDLVQVTRSSDRHLRAMMLRHQLLPYFEIRRRPDIGVEYVRQGVRYTFVRAADDPAFSQLSLLQAKLLRFRPVVSPKQVCLH